MPTTPQYGEKGYSGPPVNPGVGTVVYTKPTPVGREKWNRTVVNGKERWTKIAGPAGEVGGEITGAFDPTADTGLFKQFLISSLINLATAGTGAALGAAATGAGVGAGAGAAGAEAGGTVGGALTGVGGTTAALTGPAELTVTGLRAAAAPTIGSYLAGAGALGGAAAGGGFAGRAGESLPPPQEPSPPQAPGAPTEPELIPTGPIEVPPPGPVPGLEGIGTGASDAVTIGQRAKDILKKIIGHIGIGPSGPQVNVPVPGTGGTGGQEGGNPTDNPPTTIPVPISIPGTGGGVTGGTNIPQPQVPTGGIMPTSLGQNAPSLADLPYDPTRFRIGALLAQNALLPSTNLSSIGSLIAGG